MGISDILMIILFTFILMAIGAYFYLEYKKSQTENKIASDLKKTLKKNIKNTAENLIPDDWLVNDKSVNLDGFLDSTVETNFNGKDIFSLLKGLQGGNQSMFMSLFSNMLLEDSELLRKLSSKIGLPSGLAKPILVTSLSGTAKFINKIVTNILANKFKTIMEKDDKISTPKKRKRRKTIKVHDLNNNDIINSQRIAF